VEVEVKANDGKGKREGRLEGREKEGM